MGLFVQGWSDDVTKYRDIGRPRPKGNSGEARAIESHPGAEGVTLDPGRKAYHTMRGLILPHVTYQCLMLGHLTFTIRMRTMILTRSLDAD